MDFRKGWEPWEIQKLAKKLKVKFSRKDIWAQRGIVDGDNSGSASLDWAGKPGEGIRDIMKKAGIKVSRVFKVDASRRTKHTNAYFTGIGKVKRIVLYDTLIEKMDREEILSVLAHEAGHWKKKHVLKFIVLTETMALITFYISYHLLRSDLLTDLFHIEQGSFFAKIIILGFIGSIVSFPFGPLFNFLSRRHENEADKYSYDLTGNGESMISALVKLSKDNLSNLHPHPLYALFHYSHPPVLERIRSIRGLEK